MHRLSLHLGPPRHGWLPVRVMVGGLALEFHAWRGPSDPVRDLYQAIQAVLSGGRGTVLWHVDPDGYFFEFTRLDDIFHLRVSHARQAFFSAKETVASVHGSSEDVLAPLLVALAQFEALRAGPPHWWLTEMPQLARLRDWVSACAGSAGAYAGRHALGISRTGT